MSIKRRVLVAMSGGVDSSVAAGLLCEAGYDVVGVFMRLGAHDAPAADSCDPSTTAATPKAATSVPNAADTARTVSLPVRPATPTDERRRGCCSAEDATDARVVAGRLGIPFYALNFERDFARLIDRFADEYAVGRTPSPCVLCNSWLKFGKLRRYADAVGAELLATGHYARLDWREDAAGLARPLLRTARDARKDQSYFLFGLSPAMLRRTLFPLGDLTKQQVRAHARRLGMAVHDKSESQDICFVPDGDYAAVVRARRPDAFAPGEIRHVDGRLLGRHEGLGRYTVGQRRGVGVADGAPVYVTNIDTSSGTLTVGPRAAGLAGGLRASSVQWLIDRPGSAIRAQVRVRYNHAPAAATVTPFDSTADAARDREGVVVRFDEPQWAIAPGQAVVFYDGDVVLGGGWIDSALPPP